MGGGALVITSGDRSGERIALDAETLVGREDAPVALDDDEVSRRHALVRLTNDGATIEDLGSTNGTWVNGKRIDPGVSTPLAAGDEIRIGKTTLSYGPAGRETVVSGRAGRTVVSAHTAAPAAAPASSEPAPTGESEAPFAVPVAASARGIATRDLRVEAVTFAVVAADAVGLILYFALR